MSKKSLIILTIAIFIVSIAFSEFLWFKDIAPILNSPEQREQAEVIGKRIVKENNADGSAITSSYIVAFKFSDDSVKELRLGTDKSGEENYNSIYEGDTGILAYKEREDIEEKYKNEDIRFEGRRLISFEKDNEYGGTRIVERGLSDIAWRIICIVLIVFIALILIVIMAVS